MNHVIIGGSFAGASAAAALRESDASAVITMIAGEGVRPYYRPLIPLLLKGGDLDLSLTHKPMAGNGINMVYEPAAGVAAGSREVILSSGKRVPYDRLLIASGSSPLVPELPGLAGKGVFTLRTAADAREIRSFLPGRSKVVVAGGGLVGIKAAIALRQAGMEVTVIERLSHVLPRLLDRRGAEIITAALESSGIGIVTGDTVTAVGRRAGEVTGVSLASGPTLAADLVILALGTRPHTGFLQGSGVEIGAGIIVNETLQTTVADIYAAGDVVEQIDAATGARSLSALWTPAGEMGRVAGRNMAGAGLKYWGFLPAMCSTEILDIPVIAMGLCEPADSGCETITRDRGGNYAKLLIRDDLLVGAVFIGDTPRAGIYGSLIRNRIPLGKARGKVLQGAICCLDLMNSRAAGTAR